MLLSRLRLRVLLSLSYILLTQRFRPCTCFFLRKNILNGVGQVTNVVESPRVEIRTTSSTVPALQNIIGRNLATRKRQNTVPQHSLSDTSLLNNSDPGKSTIAILIGSAVIVGLAGTSEPSADPLEGAYDTVFNVLDATVPGSSTDLVAVALGEAIAGVIGATLTAVLRFVTAKDRKPVITEAIADSDYFIAQAGLMPTLQAVGVSPILATLGSVVFASVPSQLVKINSREKQRRVDEEISLLKLLKSEIKEKQTTPRIQIQQRAVALRQIRPAVKEVVVDPKELKPVSSSELDFVEIFSDTTRWLGYDVLKSDFGALYTGNPFSAGMTGVIFGFLAAFTARLYADLLYGVLKYGPESKQAEVRTRQLSDWFAFYTSCSLSSATLFGVYEQSKGPISRWIQGILAGGFDACLGSDSFETCFDTYIQNNAPGPSAEAQLRALATNLIIVGQRLQDIAGDTTTDDFQALARAWAVSAYSYMNHIF
jgi:hypothetical protein